jgi:biopolymer transport protein ExbD
MPRNHRAHYFGTEDKARIEIIPMIDVMMFLLVFFVLIMTEMIQGTGINVSLPQAQEATQLQAAADGRTVTLAVDVNGAWRIDGEAATPATLAEHLRAKASDGKLPALVIAGDQGVVYQHVVRAMDAARAAGVERIGLATQAPP